MSGVECSLTQSPAVSRIFCNKARVASSKCSIGLPSSVCLPHIRTALQRVHEHFTGRGYNQKPKFSHIERNGVLRFNFQCPKEYMSLERRSAKVPMEISAAAMRHPAMRPRTKSLGEKDPDMIAVTLPDMLRCVCVSLAGLIVMMRAYGLWQRRIGESLLWSCRGGDAPPIKCALQLEYGQHSRKGDADIRKILPCEAFYLGVCFVVQKKLTKIVCGYSQHMSSIY